MKSVFLSIVIPAYNESNRIVKTLDLLSDYLSLQDYSWEIVVANDGSLDRTINEIKGWTITHPLINVHLIDLMHRGKGAAVRSGMSYATGSFKMMCDADLAMPVDHISDFIREMRLGRDVVVGSREAAGAIRINESKFRHIVGRFFNWFVNLLIDSGFKDTQCGFKCFTSNAAKLLFDRQVVDGWAFDVEVLMLAKKYNMTTFELPIRWYHNSDSRLRIGPAAIEMIRDTILVKIRHIMGIYKMR